MNRFAKFGLAGVAIIAFGWWVSNDSRTLRCRRTLIVETPEGRRSGSSVVEVSIYFASGLARAQGYGVFSRTRAEATVVDLGTRGLLFATLADEDRLKTSMTHGTGLGCETPFPRKKFDGQVDAGQSPNGEYAAYFDGLNKQKPRGDVPFKYLPMLVRFRDIHDPKTVERVDPSDLAASFGPGVKLGGMSIEITDAPVSKGIESVLPWLSHLKGENLSPAPVGPVSKTPSINLLGDDDFRTLPSIVHQSSLKDRFGSKAEVGLPDWHVGFALKNRNAATASAGQFRASNGFSNNDFWADASTAAIARRFRASTGNDEIGNS